MLRELRSLFGDELGELADALTGTLRMLATEARDLA